MKEFEKDKLSIKVLETTEHLGKAAADFVAENLKRAIEKKNSANLILATGASQFSFLEHLQELELEWDKIIVFHLDEYLGMSDTHPASFRKYLRERILEKVNPKEVHYLNGDAEDASVETERYENLLKEP